MKRLGVILGGGLAVIVLAVAGIFFFVLSNIDGLVKDVIEGQGSKVAGVPVTVSGVAIKPFDGAGAISGLTIGNPPGFKSEHAVSLGGISVAIDTASVTEPVVVIREITVDSPSVIYELASGGNNIDAIRGNVEKATGGASGGTSSGSGSGGEAEKKLVIENLYIRGGSVKVAASLLDGKGLEAPLPDIHLKDIGKEGDGATPDEVAAEVMAALTAAANKAAGTLGVGKTLEGLKQNLDKITGGQLPTNAEGAKQAVDDAKGAVEGVTKELDKAGEGLKKLFGN